MAAGVYKGLTIELGADSKALTSALREAKAEAKGTASELKSIKKALKLDPGNTKLLAQQQANLKKQISATTKELEAYRKVEQSIKDGKQVAGSEQWTQLQYDITRCEQALQEYNRELKESVLAQAQAQTALGKMGAGLTEAGEKLKPIGEKMESIGRGFTNKVTLPIVAVGAASIKAATDIDTSLTNVRKTLDATDEQYEQLKDAAIAFSQVNAVSASEILDIESLGAQLGFTLDIMKNGKSEVQEFGEVVSGLDIATNMDAETAGTQLAQFANITKLSKDQISNYGSTIVGLGNNFATTESDISELAMRIAAAGTQVGMSQADILGLAASLSSLGVKAEMGGTAISTIMSNIDKDVALGSDHLKLWAETANMSVKDFSDAWKSKPVEALSAVLSGMESATAEGSNMAVMLDELGITSLRQTDVLKRLAGNSELTAKAVAKANEEWDKNTALSNEVANRNDSLAAKFEILKNRVIAVANDIGEPLADALLNVIDAAEPLFQAIESGARAFNEMSKDEQETVLRTVALIAAFGPALTMFGKVTQNITILGRALTRTSGLLTNLGLTLGKVPKGIDAASASAVTMANRTKLLETATKGAHLAIAALAAVAIAALVKSIADYVKYQNDFKTATKGINDSIQSLPHSIDIINSSVEQQEETLESTSKAWKNYGKVAADMAAKGAEFANTINESFSDAGVQAEMIQRYSDKIQQLAGKLDGSGEKFQELQAAIDGYNELTGESVSIVDEFSGAINQSTKELDANTNAYKLNAYAKASEDLMSEAMKREIELGMELDSAQQQLSESTKKLSDLEKEQASATGENIFAQDALNDQLNEATRQVEKDKEAVKSLEDQQKAAAETTEKLSKKQSEYADAAKLMADKANDAHAAVADFSAALGDGEAGQKAFAAIAEQAGLSVEELGSKLTDAGVSAEMLAKTGDKAFSQFMTAANGDITAVADTLRTLDRLGINPKTLKVDDNGTIRTADGKIIDLNKRTIGNKSFSVAVQDNASQKLDAIKTKLNGIQSKTVDVVTNVISKAITKNAEGGISKVPIKAYAHADGGIATSPILTNVGLVGEAGAEAILGNAIVPLTNKRYTKPFAQDIAQEIGMGSTTTNNIYLQYDASADANQMARDIARSLKRYQLARGV